MKIVALIGLLIAALSNQAHAQRSPDTATLDRGDGVSRFGLDFGLTALDQPPSPYDAVLRIEPYGQWVSDSGFGIYGAFPISKSLGDDDIEPDPDPALTIGNLDLGMLCVSSSASSSWVFRAGVALPTAGDGPDGVPTNRLGAYPRLTDVALAVPDATYLRLGISPLIHTSNIFLRFDLGFDLGIDMEDGGGDPPNLLRLNVGGGIDLGVLALGLELVNIARFDDLDDDDDFVHSLAFTIRFMGEALQPVIAVGIPLDERLRDEAQFFASLGIQVVF